MADPNCINAMKEELQATEKNETWSLVTLPGGKKAIDVKWLDNLLQELKVKGSEP